MGGCHDDGAEVAHVGLYESDLVEQVGGDGGGGGTYPTITSVPCKHVIAKITTLKASKQHKHKIATITTFIASASSTNKSSHLFDVNLHKAVRVAVDDRSIDLVEIAAAAAVSVRRLATATHCERASANLAAATAAATT